MSVFDLAVLVGEHDERAPWSTAALPSPSDAASAASTPINLTAASSMKPANIPMAFDPPPTHATTTSGRRPSASSNCVARFAPDDGLQLADDLWVRRGPDARADQVVRRLDVRDPVANRLARRLLERARSEIDRTHLRAEEIHPLDVRALASHVFLAHVDHALEPKPRAHRRGRDAVLSGARLGDDALLAEPPGKHGLPEGVVQLVRARVEQVLAFEIEPFAGREALSPGERRRPSGERAAELVELSTEDSSVTAARQPASSSSRAGTSVSGT